MTHATRRRLPKQRTNNPLPLEVLEAFLGEVLTLVLLDNLLAVGAEPVGAPCRVAKLADTLPEPHRSAYQRIVLVGFQDGGFPAVDASRKLAAAGIKLGATTIRNHRVGVCSCPPTEG